MVNMKISDKTWLQGRVAIFKSIMGGGVVSDNIGLMIATLLLLTIIIYMQNEKLIVRKHELNVKRLTVMSIYIQLYITEYIEAIHIN